MRVLRLLLICLLACGVHLPAQLLSQTPRGVTRSLRTPAPTLDGGAPVTMRHSAAIGSARAPSGTDYRWER